MSNTICKQRSVKTGNWINGRDTGGMAQSFSWDHLEGLMRKSGQLKDHEFVERFKVDGYGVTIYIEDE